MASFLICHVLSVHPSIFLRNKAGSTRPVWYHYGQKVVHCSSAGFAILDKSCSFITSSIKDSPIHRQHQPTQPSSCPPCLRRPQCPCRSGSDSPHRSPWVCPTPPSTCPPQHACAHRWWSPQARADEAAGARGRWRGSAESWCGGSQSRGSNGYREGRGEHRRQGSGWVHHPTV